LTRIKVNPELCQYNGDVLFSFSVHKSWILIYLEGLSVCGSEFNTCVETVPDSRVMDSDPYPDVTIKLQFEN